MTKDPKQMLAHHDIESDQIVCLMVFGSHLYDTHTPESDRDYKGVFMPSAEQILLGEIPRSLQLKREKSEGEKNLPIDVDCEMYSLHYFIKLALEGQTAALDMLHAPESAIFEMTKVWDDLRSRREGFHTSNLRAFVGYARRQAAKYGVKGSRLAEARALLDFLREEAIQEAMGGEIIRAGSRLENVWDRAPLGEYVKRIEREHPKTGEQEVFLQCCGRLLTPRERISTSIETVQSFVATYGERARKAEANEGIDWKAVSHAFRAGFVVRQILTGNVDFEYPLPKEETQILIDVKAGRLHYRDEAGPMLERLMDELEELQAKSDLPKKPNRKLWRSWLQNVTWDWIRDEARISRVS